jgi:hypothetical protein
MTDPSPHVGSADASRRSEEKKAKFVVGQEWLKPTPFIVEDRELYEDGEPVTIKSWRPGIRHEFVAPDDFEPVSDGEGFEVRRIVAVVAIPEGGRRILYRRTWKKPDGKEFGKARVRMTTTSAFTAWARDSNGWRSYDERRIALLDEPRGLSASEEPCSEAVNPNTPPPDLEGGQ